MTRIVVMAGISLSLFLAACSDGSSVNPGQSQVDATGPALDLSSPDAVKDLNAEDTAPNDPGPGSVCEEGEGCFGEPCSDSSDCLSGVCSLHQGEYVCSKTCDEECPTGWSCKLVSSSGDSQYVCVSEYTHLCLPCSDAGDCSDEAGFNACVKYAGGGTFCGGACELGAPCPEGYSCQEVDTAAGTKSFQCVSVWGECTCSSLAVESALATPCDITTPDGTCSGFRVCTEDGLSDCDALEPGPETCNGTDDNCNGQVDEGTCDDGNACTVDTCLGADGCNHEPLNGGECVDGSLCTTGDQCTEGVCVGVPTDCDDGEECTDDLCDPEFGCVATPNFASCDDGDACTVGDTCKNGACAAGPSINCDDGNPCTDDFCDASGCVHSPNEETCDDGNPCTVASACKDGGCTAIDATLCDDSNDCTTDACAPKTGCVFEPNLLPCDDGNVCTLKDACSDGACQSGALTLSCDDGNPCTDDVCDAQTGCVFTANDGACDDLNTCTTTDTCQGGACIGSGSLSCDDQNPCTVDSCLPDGGCENAPANGAPCSDGSVCTTFDGCLEGVCVPGQDLVCDDGNPCTVDACDAETGCTYTPSGAGCDDGNQCTTVDTCQEGACIGSGSLDCLDGNPCTDDGCDAAIGCTHVANTNPCDDGDLCTKEDACSDGSCGPGQPVECDDGLYCNGEESCISDTGCVPGDAPPLSDDIGCTIDACDEDIDAIIHAPSDGLCGQAGLCETFTCDPVQGCLLDTLNNCCGNGAVENGEECDDGNDLAGDGCDAGCKKEAVKDCQAVLDDNPNAGDGMYLIDPDGEGGFAPFMAECVMSIEGGGWTRFNWLKQNSYPAGTDPLEFEVAQCDPNATICRGRMPSAAAPKEFMVRDLTEGTYGAWLFDGTTISNAVLNALHKHEQSCHNNSNKFQPYATNSNELYCANGGEDGCDSFYYTSGNCPGISNWGIHWDGDNHWCSAVFKLGATQAGGCGDGDFGFMDDCDCSSEQGALYYR